MGLRSGLRSLSYFTCPPRRLQNAFEDRRRRGKREDESPGNPGRPKAAQAVNAKGKRVFPSPGPTFFVFSSGPALALRLPVPSAGAERRARFLSVERRCRFFQAGRAGARGGREAARRRTTAPCCSEKRDARDQQDNPSFPQVFRKEPRTACLTGEAERPPRLARGPAPVRSDPRRRLELSRLPECRPRHPSKSDRKSGPGSAASDCRLLDGAQ